MFKHFIHHTIDLKLTQNAVAKEVTQNKLSCGTVEAKRLNLKQEIDKDEIKT